MISGGGRDALARRRGGRAADFQIASCLRSIAKLGDLTPCVEDHPAVRWAATVVPPLPARCRPCCRPSGSSRSDGHDAGVAPVALGDPGDVELRGMRVAVQAVRRDDVALAAALRIERELGEWPRPSLR